MGLSDFGAVERVVCFREFVCEGTEGCATTISMGNTTSTVPRSYGGQRGSSVEWSAMIEQVRGVKFGKLF